MNPGSDLTCTAFQGDRLVAAGNLRDVARAAKAALDRNKDDAVRVFDHNGATVEIDFRGTIDDVLARLPGTSFAQTEVVAVRRGPGRPKLGVVAREVTLLPRHWEWLSRQPGGASVALRRLVDQARRTNSEKDRIRNAQEAAYRFISVMGENRPHYDEVARALFARDARRFAQWTKTWPADVRDHARTLAAAAFDDTPPSAIDRVTANR